LRLKCPAQRTAVSELHGEVSREMWKELFGVTDAAKVADWTHHERLFTFWDGWRNGPAFFWLRHLGDKWIYYLKSKAIWQQVADPELVPG